MKFFTAHFCHYSDPAEESNEVHAYLKTISNPKDLLSETANLIGCCDTYFLQKAFKDSAEIYPVLKEVYTHFSKNNFKNDPATLDAINNQLQQFFEKTRWILNLRNIFIY